MISYSYKCSLFISLSFLINNVKINKQLQMTSSSLLATTTRNYLLMSKMKKKLTENTVHVCQKKKNDHWLTQSSTVHVWPKQNKKNDHWFTQSDHWVTVIPPELQNSKAVITAVLFFFILMSFFDNLLIKNITMITGDKLQLQM